MSGRITKEEWVDRANDVHEDGHYCYDDTVYKGMQYKLDIYCNWCDETFTQKAQSHILGRGCKECGRSKQGKRLTSDEIMESIISVHGDRYGYEKTVINGVNNKIIVTCFEHGDFLINTHHHYYRGQGCPECANLLKGDCNRISPEEFQQTANEKFNGKFRYDMGMFVNMRTHINVECPEHGSYLQTPSQHISSLTGCPTCGNDVIAKKLRKSPETYLDEITEVYGNEYDLSEVNYVNNRTIITIGCDIHGFVDVNPRQFLKGTGCSECNRDAKPSLESFIQDSTNIHNGLYTYENATYIDSKTKTLVTCLTHGEFEVTPNHHLRGIGCRLCGYESAADLRRTSIEDFIDMAMDVHDGIYSYDKVDYKNNNTPVKIYCEQCNEYFHQSPANHINQRQGCPNHSKSLGVLDIMSYLRGQGIEYVREKKYKDCRGEKKPLSFDLYLPEFDLLMEYDGRQHFEYIPSHFHKKGYWQFEQQQEYDRIKNEYAKQNGIHLLRIPYFEDTIDTLSNYMDKFL